MSIEERIETASDVEFALTGESIGAQVANGPFSVREDRIFRLGFIRGVVWANNRALERLQTVIKKHEA
jgi:hypothetical protein